MRVQSKNPKGKLVNLVKALRNVPALQKKFKTLQAAAPGLISSIITVLSELDTQTLKSILPKIKDKRVITALAQLPAKNTTAISSILSRLFNENKGVLMSLLAKPSSIITQARDAVGSYCQEIKIWLMNNIVNPIKGGAIAGAAVGAAVGAAMGSAVGAAVGATAGAFTGTVVSALLPATTTATTTATAAAATTTVTGSHIALIGGMAAGGVMSGALLGAVVLAIVAAIGYLTTTCAQFAIRIAVQGVNGILDKTTKHAQNGESSSPSQDPDKTK